MANAKYYGTGRRKKSIARVYLVPGTGKITVGATKVSKNPIPDVALTLAEILEHDNTREKVIMMSSGDTLIEQALASV